MKIKKNIVLIHGINYWNIGDLGITDAMLSLFKNKFPNANITVLSPYFHWKKPDKTKLEHSVTELPDYFLFPNKDKFDSLFTKFGFFISFFWKLFRITFFILFFRLFKKSCWFFIKNDEKKAINTYIQSDVVVSKGGGFLYDRGKFTLSPHALPIIMGIALKKPVVIYAQSIGPFKRSLSFWIYKKIFKRVSDIIVREKKSQELLEKMGINNVILGMDAAFTLETTSNKLEKTKIDNLITNIREQGFLLVGMSVLNWNFPYSKNGTPQELQRKYVESLAKEVNLLQKSKNAYFFFFPHSIGGMESDDRVVVSDVIKLSGIPKSSFQVVDTEHNPRVLSYFLGRLDMCIGSRMHSNIFTIRGGTPLVAISYLPKTSGIMKLLGFEDYVIEIDQITPEIIKDKVDLLLKNIISIREQIKLQNKIAENNATKNVSILDKYLS